MKDFRSVSRRMAAALLLLGACALSSSATAQSQAAPEQSRIIRVSASAEAAPHHMLLALNNAAIIELDRDARDVLVANPQIVDAVVRTPRRIFVMSLKIGQTNAIFLDAQGRQIATVEIVVGSDVTGLNDQLVHQLPGTTVKAVALNDNIVLSGSVNTVQEASQAQNMAQRFAGAVDKVVNNISIEQRQQVLIQVRVSEISRTISKQLGINLSGAVNAAGVPIAAGTGNQFSLIGRALSDLSGGQFGSVCARAFTPSRTIDTTSINNTSTNPKLLEPGIANGTSITSNVPCASPNNVQGMVQALERIGLVHTLAEPNLTAISGEAAKFLAGGEFPVPVGRDRNGNITIEYKPFGVGLSFTPVVLSKGRISLQISTEVSELTNVGAFALDAGAGAGGLTLPALAVRRTGTTVELPSGGSLAIGGLIQQQTKQNLDAFPGVKDLPVLGALFRSRDFQNNESELVVTVTAYLVNPVSPTQIAHPDDGYVVPADPETILLGRLNAVYGKETPAPTAPRNSVGYIVQ